jgi:electron transport complex protein RnfG
MPQSNVKKIISLGVTLFAVTAVTGVILGVVRDITLEPIRVTQERLKAEALRGALPEAEEFKPVAVESAGSSETPGKKPKLAVKDVREALSGGDAAGYCITVASQGYAGPIELVAGVTPDGNLRAIRLLSQSETPGLGARSAEEEFYGQFKDAGRITVVKTAPSNAGEIQAISGATITSSAVADGVNAALDYWRNYLAPGAAGEPAETVSGASLPAESAGAKEN